MDIKILVEGPFGTNCYILIKDGHAVVIDPNYQVSSIIKNLEGLVLDSILLTHGHIDHISALNELCTLYPEIPVYCHKEEEVYLRNPEYNLSTMLLQQEYAYKGNVQFLKDGKYLTILGSDIKCLHTPGHSLGSLSFCFPEYKWIISGDVLFKNSIGRTDFIGCNYQHLMDSIKNKIFLLPEETVIYPGHGESTTIKYEKENNFYVK